MSNRNLSKLSVKSAKVSIKLFRGREKDAMIKHDKTYMAKKAANYETLQLGKIINSKKGILT